VGESQKYLNLYFPSAQPLTPSQSARQYTPSAILADEMPKLTNKTTNKTHGQTGPTSPEGKEQSSQNSTTHGCRSMKHRILPGESEEEYNQLHARWFGEYRPKNDLDATMLERVVQAEWRMVRCEQQFAETEAHIGLKPLHEWTDQDEKVMLRARRYFSQAQRFYTHARHDLDNLRLTRQHEMIAIVNAAKAMQRLPEQNPNDPEISQEAAIRPTTLFTPTLEPQPKTS
jgi:hypothetical protein